MEDTLYNNQQLIVDKLSYNFRKPHRGDIIIFFENGKKGTIIDDTIRFKDSIAAVFYNNSHNLESENNRLVKRVVGIPGDEIDIKNGCVFLNGEKLDEKYAKGETVSEKVKFPIRVGENELFVLGDNRAVSKDSREFGFVNYNQVEGRVIFRVFPFKKIGAIK
ncbi:signal peptidase I [Clostridiales bacterium oral taxon 876 str. F0540]|nr:signal peptidase I [Clostridiales bacterium oral taxon 876 str. F0540]